MIEDETYSFQFTFSYAKPLAEKKKSLIQKTSIEF